MIFDDDKQLQGEREGLVTLLRFAREQRLALIAFAMLSTQYLAEDRSRYLKTFPAVEKSTGLDISEASQKREVFVEYSVNREAEVSIPQQIRYPS